MNAPVKNDREARYLEFAREVLTERGREIFLQEVGERGGVEEVAKSLDLPEGRVLALLAMHKDASEQVAMVLRLKTHELRAETLKIADESGEAKLMMDARRDLSKVWNREDYGDKQEVVVRRDEPTTPEGMRARIEELEKRLGVKTIEGEVIDAEVVKAAAPVRI